jgi:hypothetical protein
MVAKAEETVYGHLLDGGPGRAAQVHGRAARRRARLQTEPILVSVGRLPDCFAVGASVRQCTVPPHQTTA